MVLDAIAGNTETYIIVKLKVRLQEIMEKESLFEP